MTSLRAQPFAPFFERATSISLTRAQRVLAALAFDGVQPCDLEAEDRAIAAAKLVGAGVETIPAASRDVIALVKGARVAGTLMGAIRGLHLAVTSGPPPTAPGERLGVLFVGPDLRHARHALRYARAAAKRLRLRIVEDTSDSFVMVRRDGREVAFECLPATRGGSAVRGRSLIFAHLIEAAFFRDANYVVNDEDVFKGIAPRIVAGGQVWIESTPFAEGGLLFDLFQRNYGHPTTELAIHAPTLLMRPDARMARIVERERERDPDNAAREFDAEFMTAGAGLFFDGASVDRCRLDLLEVPRGSTWYAGADFGFVSDASAIVLVAKAHDGALYVVDTDEVRPTRGNPLRPSAVVERFALVARARGCSSLTADAHYRESVAEHLTANALRLDAAPEGQKGKAASYIELRKAIVEGRLRFADKRIGTQLKTIVSKPAPGGGLAISAPRRGNGGHADLVSALVCAVWAARSAAAIPEHDFGAFARALPLGRWESARSYGNDDDFDWDSEPEEARARGI